MDEDSKGQDGEKELLASRAGTGAGSQVQCIKPVNLKPRDCSSLKGGGYSLMSGVLKASS